MCHTETKRPRISHKSIKAVIVFSQRDHIMHSEPGSTTLPCRRCLGALLILGAMLSPVGPSRVTQGKLVLAEGPQSAVQKTSMMVTNTLPRGIPRAHIKETWVWPHGGLVLWKSGGSQRFEQLTKLLTHLLYLLYFSSFHMWLLAFIYPLNLSFIC